MTSDQSYTIIEFCDAERISRSMLYKLWQQGKGPRWYNIGVTRRISHDARTDWRRAREAEAGQGGERANAVQTRSLSTPE